MLMGVTVLNLIVFFFPRWGAYAWFKGPGIQVGKSILSIIPSILQWLLHILSLGEGVDYLAPLFHIYEFENLW